MEYTGNVRIGNWQEKKVIDALGRFDYKDRSTQILTGARVIFHDDKVEPKDYASTQGSTYPDPKSFPSYSAVNPAGPRQKAMEARLKAQIDGEFAERAAIKAEEGNRRELQSTARTTMAASGFVPRAEKARESSFETRNADYATETAVTYYTHTLENSKKGLNFPVTLVSNMNKPWSKVSQVSEDLGNGTKRVRENWEHPQPLPTLVEMKILKSLRQSLMTSMPGDGTPGSKVRELFLFLLPFDRGGKGWVYVEEVSSGLSEHYGVEWGSAEKQALLRAFDHDRCHGIPPGRMRIREFMDLVRSALSPRKQEIIEILFNIIDSSRSGFVTVEDILSRWQGPEKILDSFLQSLEIYNGHAANLMQSVELREESYGERVFSVFYKDFVTENGEDTEMFEQFVEDCWRMD
jgi:hypothetical protein